MKKIAVILAGCGYLDGAEIRESVLTLLALDTLKIDYDIFSLNENQLHVVNHLTGEVVENEHRNILEESARIARGKVADVAKVNVDEYVGLILPGGFGVAKNLSSFAFEGINGKVKPAILNIIKAFHDNKKPIGAICISPALIALSLGNSHPRITLGCDPELAKEIEKTGAKHSNCEPFDCIIDEKNKIVSTPAYMVDGVNLSDVYSGIFKLVRSVLDLA